MASLSADEVEIFLSETRVAVIGTTGRDGQPNLVPIWFTWEDGAAYLFTSRSTLKWRNILERPRASLCVDHREPPYRSVILEGVAEEVPDRSLYDYVRAMALRYYGPSEGDAFAEGYRERPDVAIFRIVPSRIVSRASE